MSQTTPTTTSNFNQDWPWLLLFQTPAIALRGRVMLLSTAGVLAMVASDALLTGKSITPRAPEAATLGDVVRAAPAYAAAGWQALVKPFFAVATGEAIAVNLVLCMLRIAIWGLIGGAICRIAALSLTRDESPDVRGALKYAWRMKSGFVGGSLLMLVGLLVATMPLILTRLAMQATWLAPVAAVLWPLVVVAAVVATLYAIGATIGWPLLMASTATDGSDAFDGVSRMFAYVYQKPLRLLGYAVVVGSLGVASAIAAQAFAAGVLHACLFAAGGVSSPWAATTIAFWNGAATALVSVYLTAFLWTAATGVYLLRRHDVDGVHIDEVSIDAGEFAGENPSFAEGPTGVPELKKQSADAA